MEIVYGFELVSIDFCGLFGKVWWKEKMVIMIFLIFCYILEWLLKIEVL